MEKNSSQHPTSSRRISRFQSPSRTSTFVLLKLLESPAAFPTSSRQSPPFTQDSDQPSLILHPQHVSHILPAPARDLGHPSPRHSRRAAAEQPPRGAPIRCCRPRPLMRPGCRKQNRRCLLRPASDRRDRLRGGDLLGQQDQRTHLRLLNRRRNQQ